MIMTHTTDETPPEIVEEIVTERTDTSITINMTVSEQIRKVRMRYRIFGATDWIEEDVTPLAYWFLNFDITLSGLSEGDTYEYQYIIDDREGNQHITDWRCL
jgi:hypothetical protein